MKRQACLRCRPPTAHGSPSLSLPCRRPGALAIGVDFYFKTPNTPAKDEALVSAIRDSKAPVVIAAVNDAYLQTDAQKKFLGDFIERTHRPAGHIGLKRAKEIFSLGDRATRGVIHNDPDFPYPSLSSTLAQLPEAVAVFGSRDIPDGQQRIDWLLEPEHGQVLRYAVRQPYPSRGRQRRI